MSRQNANIPEEVYCSLQIAQAAEVHIRRVQRFDGWKVSFRLHPGRYRVLLGIRGEILLCRLGKKEIDKLQGRFLAFRCLKDSGTSYKYKSSRVAISNIKVSGFELGAVFIQEPFRVIVINETYIDLTIGGGLNYRSIVGVFLGVIVLHAFQLFASHVFSQLQPQGSNKRLEGAVAGGPANPSSPFRSGEVEN